MCIDHAQSPSVAHDATELRSAITQMEHVLMVWSKSDPPSCFFVSSFGSGVGAVAQPACSHLGTIHLDVVLRADVSFEETLYLAV